MKSIWLALAGCFLLACSATNEDFGATVGSEYPSRLQIADIISEKMQAQQDAWNRGSLDEFMAGYWESDSLKFIGSSGLNYGWQRTLDNYKKSYPTADSMGVLQFNNISIDRLSNNAALVIGKWTLYRDKVGDTLKGHYSLNWQIKEGEWVIIADHSS